MASRVSGNYAVPYNPREWAGGSRRTSMIENRGSEAESLDFPKHQD